MGKKSRKAHQSTGYPEKPPWKIDTRSFEKKLRFAEHDIVLNDEITFQLKKIKQLRLLMRNYIESNDEAASHDVAIYINKVSSFLKANIAAKQRDELNYYVNLEKYKGFSKMELELNPRRFLKYLDDSEEFLSNNNVENFCKEFIASEKNVQSYLKIMPLWYFKHDWWSYVREEIRSEFII